MVNLELAELYRTDNMPPDNTSEAMHFYGNSERGDEAATL